MNQMTLDRLNLATRTLDAREKRVEHKPSLKDKIRVLRQHPETLARFTKLRKRVFPIFPSQYDITNICNLNCVGCLYFDGDEMFDGQPETDPDRLDRFFKAERQRGVNYAHIGGAEPALNPAALRAASKHIPRGVVYTNGHRRIAPDIGFRVHVSIWAVGDSEALLRGQGVLAKALENYANDPRAVFVLTLSKKSVGDLDEVAKICASNRVTLTFNHFSPTIKGTTPNAHLRRSQISSGARDLDLALTRDSLRTAYSNIDDLRARYPNTVRFSTAFVAKLTKPGGLYKMDPSTGVATNCASRLNKDMRRFLPNLKEERGTKCCTPHINCATCGLYAMAFATMIDELSEVPAELSALEEWIEVVETWESLFC